MKQRMALFILSLTFLFSAPGRATTDLQSFLKNCAYGTLGGAALGVVSLVLTDKPSEHTVNIARGASLGLYAGIGYGLIKLNEKEVMKNDVDPYATFVPLFNKSQQIDGARLLLEVARF